MDIALKVKDRNPSDWKHSPAWQALVGHLLSCRLCAVVVSKHRSGAHPAVEGHLNATLERAEPLSLPTFTTTHIIRHANNTPPSSPLLPHLYTCNQRDLATLIAFPPLPSHAKLRPWAGGFSMPSPGRSVSRTWRPGTVPDCLTKHPETYPTPIITPLSCTSPLPFFATAP